jgi:hypothetical protein
MPSVKIKKHAPENDMTPMVDLAFLILAFFMLATNSNLKMPPMLKYPAQYLLMRFRIKTCSPFRWIRKEGHSFRWTTPNFARCSLRT